MTHFLIITVAACVIASGIGMVMPDVWMAAIIGAVTILAGFAIIMLTMTEGLLSRAHKDAP